MELNRSAISDVAELENGVPTSREHGISSACDRLRSVEKLLLNPNPQTIEHAGFVLQEALSFTQTCFHSTLAVEKLADFNAACARVKILLEGARRAQWAYLHRVGAATSTYTAGPGTKCWTPRAWTLDVQA